MLAIKYACLYSTHCVSEAEYDIIHFLYAIGHKIMAIKFLKEQYHLGLKESRDICETIALVPRAIPRQ